MADSSRQILARLHELREADAPHQGGRVLSYVYDTGLEAIDELAAEAIRAMQGVNGLDPTAFGSVAVLEREIVAFARDLLGGDEDVVGSVTAGGTESCLLAVKAARDVWCQQGGSGAPRLLVASTAHAAFHKAARLLGLRLELVPVDPASGVCPAAALIERLGPDVALTVVSAPCYPVGVLDPVAQVAAACAEAGVACHVDACVGGWILPFWPQGEAAAQPAWDLRVPGVTSLSVDLHKYGYAPKGASVLLQRGRDRQRAQFFGTTDWPGYPVVNPTLLGSKSAGPMAAAWAIIQYLGHDGFSALAQRCARATATLRRAIEGIEGLRVLGDPVGPLLAVTSDEGVPAARRVDPHQWADAVRERGWLLQMQPGYTQSDGTHLPATTHLTITPVTEAHSDALCQALRSAADALRGTPPIEAADLLGNLPAALTSQLAACQHQAPDSDAAAVLLEQILAVGGSAGDGGLPQRMAPVMALVEGLPRALSERLLIELLARLVEPRG